MKMKLLILTACVAVASCDEAHLPSPEQNAKIVSQEFDIGEDGSYQWAFQTDNDISVRANGALNKPNGEDSSLIVQGSAQWSAPDGEVVRIEYIADENGYQPQGRFIPTPLPIPEAILRGLQYIRDHPPPPEKK